MSETDGLVAPYHNPKCPPAYDGCTCACHSTPDVIHFVACCGPGRRKSALGRRDVDALFDELRAVVYATPPTKGTTP